MRALLVLSLVSLLAFAPTALAQEEPAREEPAPPEEEAPQDGGNAWVEDCPPDMMCAYQEGEPQPYGNESCIECSGMPQDDPHRPVDDGTCMDGADANETCAEDVRYLDGGDGSSGAPEPAIGEESAADASGGQTNAVPSAGGVLVGAALLGAAFLVARRR